MVKMLLGKSECIGQLGAGLFVCLFVWGVNKASQEGALQRHPGIELFLISPCTAAMTWAAIGVSHFISGGIFTHLAGRGSPKDVLQMCSSP